MTYQDNLPDCDFPLLFLWLQLDFLSLTISLFCFWLPLDFLSVTTSQCSDRPRSWIIFSISARLPSSTNAFKRTSKKVIHNGVIMLFYETVGKCMQELEKVFQTMNDHFQWKVRTFQNEMDNLLPSLQMKMLCYTGDSTSKTVFKKLSDCNYTVVFWGS